MISHGLPRCLIVTILQTSVKVHSCLAGDMTADTPEVLNHMPHETSTQAPPFGSREAGLSLNILRAVCLYAAFASLWILLSDKAGVFAG